MTTPAVRRRDPFKSLKIATSGVALLAATTILFDFVSSGHRGGVAFGSSRATPGDSLSGSSDGTPPAAATATIPPAIGDQLASAGVGDHTPATPADAASSPYSVPLKPVPAIRHRVPDATTAAAAPDRYSLGASLPARAATGSEEPAAPWSPTAPAAAAPAGRSAIVAFDDRANAPAPPPPAADAEDAAPPTPDDAAPPIVVNARVRVGVGEDDAARGDVTGMDVETPSEPELETAAGGATPPPREPSAAAESKVSAAQGGAQPALGEDGGDVPAALLVDAETRAETDAFIARGDAFLENNDAASARLYYQLALRRGREDAAVLMGNTYDPVYLSDHAIRGVRPDAREALKWYMDAVAAGYSQAAEPMRRLIAHLERAARVGDAEARRILDDLEAVPGVGQ